MQKSNFQFKTPLLTNVEFTLNDDYNSTETSINLKSEFSAKVYKNLEEKTAYERLDVILGDSTSGQPFYLKVTMEAEFTWEYDINEDDLNKLLSQNAPSVLLSYARPIVANLTSSSPFPTYNIPFMNFTKEQINFE